jgi:GMP synthase (glutamine-hydrolysing)
MKLNIHYYQHVSYEGLAVIQKWADLNGHNLSKTNFKNNEPIPNPDMYDILIVLGGPMSVNDESKYPWLKTEKKSINRCLNDGKKVIGICLGAQMLAEVLGAKVYKSELPEVGWHNIFFTENKQNFEAMNVFPDELNTFHWHYETFDLPSGCSRIAYSQSCDNQIFAYGDIAVGFQCHLEQNEYLIGRMLDRSGSQLENSKFIQPKEEILANIHHANYNNKLLFEFLDKYTA